MSLTSSTLSLDGYIQERRDDLYNSGNRGHESSSDFVNKRRRRWTPQKYQSLDNLAARSLGQVRNFGSIEGIHDASWYFCKKPAVWKAYGKFVKGAWRKSRAKLMMQTRKAEELELRERSALIQMSSVKALLTKDKEIMRSQTAELSAMTRSLRALENECGSLKELNLVRRAEVQNTHEEVNRLNDTLSNGKLALVTATKSELNELERIVAEKEKKRVKYSTEIGIKKLKIEELKKETASNYQTIEKMQNDIEKLDVKIYRLREKVLEAEIRCKNLEGLVEQRVDEKYMLSKDLSEVREANQKVDAEVISLQVKLLDQDMRVVELDKLLKMQSEELASLQMGLVRSPGSKWDKLICGVWAASFALQLVKAVDRRWP
uniref:Myosin heavy chain, non-muscle n=1 Tax=Lygus hesperus TaxID=30085 RepID=A0A0A9X2X3_LYGHE